MGVADGKDATVRSDNDAPPRSGVEAMPTTGRFGLKESDGRLAAVRR